MQLLRPLAMVLALSLIGFGMVQRDDERWLLCLWAAAPLLTLALWPLGPRLAQGLRRGIQNLGVVFAVMLLLLSLQLLRVQVIWADTIYNRAVTDGQGRVTSNVRIVRQALRVLRGTIVDRDGTPLATSQEVAGGFALRTYPIAEQYNLEAFSHMLGFVSTRYGLSGLEEQYNSYLTGERGSTWDKLNDQVFSRQQRGNNLKLTIDADLQARVYELLAGRRGSVVVLDPQTGAVRALASFPGFDPRGLTYNPGADSSAAENERISNYWAQLITDERKPLLNRPIQGLYPPGSTFKTVTAAGALQHAADVKPDEITCPNEFKSDPNAPPVVNAVEDEARFTGDPSDLRRVFAFSCNTAFAQYGQRLGPERLEQVSESFHIYSPDDAPELSDDFDGLPLTPSLLYIEDDFLQRATGLADTSFGQGQLLTTPLQMALVAAAVGNEGTMMRAYIVEEITDPDGGIIRRARPQVAARPLAPETARDLKEIMRAVVENGWDSAKAAGVQGVVVGGKSGTAENVPGAPTHAWFIALAPLDNPRYAVAVMVENGGEGSSVGGQLAGDVLRAAFALEQ